METDPLVTPASINAVATQENNNDASAQVRNHTLTVTRTLQHITHAATQKRCELLRIWNRIGVATCR